jgi:peptidoglycan/xylan/chitin deacetylase (PgdA/CDA1 family)
VLAVLRKRFRNAVFDRLPGVLRRGPAGTKRVALTFDDGPDDRTPEYLELLDRLGVPATFFVNGANVVKQPEMVREYVRRGHQVASHGFEHEPFPALGPREMLAQCARTDEAIGGQLTGRPWVRPPYGALDTKSVLALLASGYTIAMWSLDSCDHTERDPEVLGARCAPDKVRPGEVLLFHEGQPWTLSALPAIVGALHGAAYEFVTMLDLFTVI